MHWNFLTERLDPDALYFDCRSEGLYAESTIQGAYGAAFAKKPFGSGPQSLSKLSGYLSGVIQAIENEKKSSIVVFDEGAGMYASRLTWLLMGAGITDVKILYLRFSEIPGDYKGEGAGQISLDAHARAIKLKGIASVNQVKENLTRVQLIDARTPDEFEGRLPRMNNSESGDICGRIPGSVNWDWRNLYGPDGHLKDRFEIMEDVRRIGLIQERPTIIYDYNGARSATTALVLGRSGYRHVSVYLGSWMEWRKTRLPKQNMRIYAGPAVH